MDNLIEKNYYDSTKGITEEILNDKETWYNYVYNLPITQQVVYTIVIFHSQIENGGFHQYFFNSYGQFGYLTLKNLKLIGSVNRYILLEKALKEVNDEGFDEKTFRKLIYTRSIQKIVSFEKKLLSNLNEIDNCYYKIGNEDIYELLEQYLATH